MQYLCEIQTCDAGDILLENVFNMSQLEDANMSSTLHNGCQFENITTTVDNLLNNTLSCTNVQGIYHSIIDEMVCGDFYNLFVYTLWPIGIGAITTILTFTMSILDENDYKKISGANVVI